MRTIAAVLSLAASALAYSVSQPNSNQGWTTTGPNIVSWSRVDTDAKNFTLVLVNQDRSVMPQNDQVLSAFVDGTTGQLTASPPSGGWPTGKGFQVNLVEDPNHLNTILAQSNQFTITQGTSSVSSVSGVSTPASVASTPVVSAANPTGTNNAAGTDGSLNPSQSLTDTSPSPSNAAGRLAIGSQGILAMGLAALGALLA
ncbi:hypothetical protein DENSPDRAFT_856324 [Dentipellis sp. KUC8613]|nr:hypothetical protein DENSPDRAFT_856324 [Dentipellis sp. KUC8613]